MKSVIAAALIMLVSFPAASEDEIPAEGSKGAWNWKENIATTDLGSGIKLMIAFSEVDNCDESILMVGGNISISEFGLTIDGQFYGYTPMTSVPGTVIKGVALGSAILDAIKNGSSATVTTNVGSAPVSLFGSAKAINSAFGNCREHVRPLVGTPSMPPVPSAQPQMFSGKKVRTNGSEMIAGHDVVFIFDDIQSGDDLLLSELVGEMEDAGVHLKSVMFVQNGGGALVAAMKMGSFIRKKGANTAVGGFPMQDGGAPYCASACVFAFAGGVQRTIYLPAKIGMHQVSRGDGSAGTMEDGQTIVAASYEYFSRMGIDPTITIEASKKPSDEMWWLSGYEAKGYGLATRVTKPHEVYAPKH